MAIKSGPSFDPKSFLTMVGEGRSIGEYRKDEIVFSQEDHGEMDRCRKSSPRGSAAE